jgi:hypothetical protein
MAEYRAYVLGAEDRVLKTVQLVCSDDDTAKQYIQQLAERDLVELWRDKHPVAKFNPRQK